MGHGSMSALRAGEKEASAIDRKREKERRIMIQAAYRNAEELALRIVQRLLDNNIIETSSESDIREVISRELTKIGDMEDFDIQFKIAPIRQITANPNFLSLYLTQFVTEDLINHPKIEDIFGDDIDIYKSIDSILDQIRPKGM